MPLKERFRRLLRQGRAIKMPPCFSWPQSNNNDDDAVDRARPLSIASLLTSDDQRSRRGKPLTFFFLLQALPQEILEQVSSYLSPNEQIALAQLSPYLFKAMLPCLLKEVVYLQRQGARREVRSSLQLLQPTLMPDRQSNIAKYKVRKIDTLEVIVGARFPALGCPTTLEAVEPLGFHSSSYPCEVKRFYARNIGKTSPVPYMQLPSLDVVLSRIFTLKKMLEKGVKFHVTLVGYPCRALQNQSQLMTVLPMFETLTIDCPCYRHALHHDQSDGQKICPDPVDLIKSFFTDPPPRGQIISPPPVGVNYNKTNNAIVVQHNRDIPWGYYPERTATFYFSPDSVLHPMHILDRVQTLLYSNRMRFLRTLEVTDDMSPNELQYLLAALKPTLVNLNIKPSRAEHFTIYGGTPHPSRKCLCQVIREDTDWLQSLDIEVYGMCCKLFYEAETIKEMFTPAWKSSSPPTPTELKEVLQSRRLAHESQNPQLYLPKRNQNIHYTRAASLADVRLIPKKKKTRKILFATAYYSSPCFTDNRFLPHLLELAQGHEHEEIHWLFYTREMRQSWERIPGNSLRPVIMKWYSPCSSCESGHFDESVEVLRTSTKADLRSDSEISRCLRCQGERGSRRWKRV